ncbi:hypothetical protein GALMADRAFT_137330 [Galerina marginata CBS 339.88]|uniref:F-box domain-containing protein n=1 Tax=Galerina marginata (strain CBS 339.88) TaxID=685588 RepID=A0A067TB02_GALM3|nr:hypothetical protein GALMADRAFT_137330 [Galerina marginata CBS 339.88]
MDPVNTGLDLLPTDIWLKIVDEIIHSDSESEDESEALMNISSTCRAFRWLTLPLICSTLTIHTYVLDDSLIETWEKSERTPPSSAQMDREIQRLEFFSSSPIASYVRYLILCPWRQPPFESSWPLPATDIDFTDSLVHKFYQAVPRFQNAQSLECTDSDFDSFALQQISQLPKLKFMDLTNCNILPSAKAPVQLRINTLHFMHQAKSDTLLTLGVDRWLRVLDLSKLQELRVYPDRLVSFFFHGMGPTYPSDLNTLSRLFISVSARVLTQLPLLLSKTPGLRHLSISSWPSDFENRKRILETYQPPLISPTPNIEVYRGPYELLHIILPVTKSKSGKSQLHLPTLPLRRLYLNSLLLPSGEHFKLLHQSLSSPHYSLQLSGLTHFYAKVCSIEYDDVVEFCALLPVLQELSLEAMVNTQNVTRETFLDDLLTIPLSSSHMRSLAINWTTNNSVDYVVSKHKQVQTQLVKRFPLLEKLWLCDWRRAALLWHRSVPGREISMVYETGTHASKINEAIDARLIFFSTAM